MKKLLWLIAFLIFASLANAQTEPLFKIDSTYTFGRNIYTLQQWNNLHPKIDTVKNVMLLCDTFYIGSPLIWQYGYTIKKSNSLLVTYLDENKKPLKSSIIVWMSKDIIK